MFETLQALHKRIRECALHHHGLCMADTPESGRLVLSRLRLLNTNADRTRFLASKVLPILQAKADPMIDAIVARLAEDLTSRQSAFKAHVERWDASAIEREWSAYQQAALRALAGVEQRVRLEADALGPILSRSN